MSQCVSEIVQVSNLYLQRGGAKFQFSVSGRLPNSHTGQKMWILLVLVKRHVYVGVTFSGNRSDKHAYIDLACQIWMQLEWKFFVHSYIIQLRSKTSSCIPTAFQVFWSILVCGWNVLLMLKTFQLHSKRKCIPTAFQLHSNCILNIRMTFQQHLKRSNRILGHSNIKTCQIARELRSNNVERGFGAIFVQQSNCTRTAFEVHSKSSSCILTVFQVFLLCSNYIRAAFWS